MNERQTQLIRLALAAGYLDPDHDPDLELLTAQESDDRQELKGRR